MAKKIFGHAGARLYTEPMRTLNRAGTQGHEIIDWLEDKIGWHPLPWQRYLILRAHERREDGTLRFSRICVLAPRQCGKSSLISALACYWLAHGQSTLYSSATLDVSREQWQITADRIEDHPEVFGKVKRRAVNGMWAIEAPRFRSQYNVVSQNRRGGRGRTAARAVIDEVRELRDWSSLDAIQSTTLAVPQSQVWYVSNAGDRSSVPLNQIRAQGMDGTDDSLGFFEWSAPMDLEIDSMEAWRWIPALGHTIQPSNVRTLMGGPPASFRTEVLCQSVPSLHNAVEPAAWEACLDAQPIKDKSRVALGFDVSPDLRHATLVAASTGSDGRTRVETVAVWDSPAEVRQALPDLVAKIKPKSLGWFPAGPASGLAADLKEIRRSVELSGVKVTTACMELSEQISSGMLRHNGDPMLSAGILEASKVKVGDAFKFGRNGDSYVDSAYAMAAAVFLSRQIPASKPFKLISAQTSEESAQTDVIV